MNMIFPLQQTTKAVTKKSRKHKSVYNEVTISEDQVFKKIFGIILQFFIN